MNPLQICVLQSSLILLSCIFLAMATTVHNPDTIFLNCGSSGISTAFSGQKWVGDVDLETSLVTRWTKGRLVHSSPIDKKLTSVDPVPYATAQLSRFEFMFDFQVSPGPKFIRLHFYPASYPGFQRSGSLFTVKAGPFTLLSNFSASLTADDLGVKVFTKEFVINIAQAGQRPLHISFSPSNSSSSSYAFVNGIEVVSMPTGLYYTPMGDAGVEVVGQKYRLLVGENTAMELVKRLNVGGSSISSMHDPGLFREWSDDTPHLQGSGFSPISTTSRIKYKEMPTFIAPQRVYQTSWSMDPSKPVSSNFTWRLLVDSGFKYLVRFHFCELHYEIMDSGKREFSIFINDQIAESNRDLIKWAGEIGVAVYKDYVIEMKGHENGREGKLDLLVSIRSHQNLEMDEPVDAILKALELFKLSNPDNNLAVVNPVVSSQHSDSHKSLFIPIVGQGIGTIVVTLLTALIVIVYAVRVWSEKLGKENGLSPQLGVSCRCFSLKELRSATNNFDERLVIGRGGFGKVYKGRISVGDGAKFVAIKRRNKTSEQGETEFLKEIEMLSNFKDAHLVSLIGCCNKRHEMILVYEYMTRGTLADHLYKINREGNHVLLSLSWEKRLSICLDAAHGLNYLHTGAEKSIIHRDVKSTNILLDENWVAKIADFGLCKTGPTSHPYTHISTAVKGSFGYLDPDYYLNRRLTIKSDVFAFGVVMLEIICGRPAFDETFKEAERNLERWAKAYIENGSVEDIIDPNLRGRVPRDCLNIFVNVAKGCLYNDPSDRPTMEDVIAGLYDALGTLYQDGISRTEEAKELAQDDPDHESCSSSSIAQGSVPSTAISLQIVQRRRFSLSELKLATNNFHDALVIGKGGFGNVYKGHIDKGSKNVAIKRLNAMSKQGQDQFWAEINTLSKLLHINLITLIGYCDENKEMILVYEYMINDSLAHHLFKTKRPISFHQHETSESSPLSWKRRLQICISAARGLDYLHSGAEDIVIHRDVKSSNILLDENWVAKMSDFGLAKMVGNSHYYTGNQSSTSILTNVKGTVGYLDAEITSVETVVKGTFGYIDPDYFITSRLSRKSDIYAFGVVLFEVLCGRPAIDNRLEGEDRSLASWARCCINEGRVEDLIDPFLKGKISPRSLMIFVGIAEKCLHSHPSERPRMSEVLQNLEFALSSKEQMGWLLTEVDGVKELEEVATNTVEDVSGDSRRTDAISKWDGTDMGVTSNTDDVSESKETAGDGILTTNHLSETSSLYEQRTHGTGTSIQLLLGSTNLNHGNIPEFPRIFSFAEIRTATRNFHPLNNIDSGEWYKGSLDDGELQVAIERCREENEEYSLSEVNKLYQLHNVHIVSFIGYCKMEEEIFLVYEFMAKGILSNHLYGSQIRPLPWMKRLDICVGIASGLHYLHQQNITHGNLKSSKILLDNNWSAKISGLKVFKENEDDLIGITQTIVTALDRNILGYMDPEYLKFGHLTKKSDVYSFGVVLLEVICARKAIDSLLLRREKVLVHWFKESIRNRNTEQVIDPNLMGAMEPECLRKFVQIALSCLHDLGRKRPSMDVVLGRLQHARQIQETTGGYLNFGIETGDPQEKLHEAAALAYNKELFHTGNRLEVC